MEENDLIKCANTRKIILEGFRDCQKAIIALGDETRQSIIATLLVNDKVGMRVGEITAKTCLSRPAVSHHLQILKDAKIIAMKRCGTKNYYYIDANLTEWEKLTNLINAIHETVIDANNSSYPFMGDED